MGVNISPERLKDSVYIPSMRKCDDNITFVFSLWVTEQSRIFLSHLLHAFVYKLGGP